MKIGELRKTLDTLADDCEVVVNMPHPTRVVWEADISSAKTSVHGDRRYLVLCPREAIFRPIIGSAQ